MFRFVFSGVAALAVTAFVPDANAYKAHDHNAAHHLNAEKVRFGGKPGLGYWRRGPATGYGFAFSSYRRDPFGSDDYYDGDRCYYLHHKNFCVANKIFNGFD
jgi:hypothetical protein